MEDGNAGATETASPAVETESQTSTGAASPTGGASTPAVKTYDEKQVAEIVSKRVNEIQDKYKGFGDPESLKSRLTRAEQIEKQLQEYAARQNAPKAETPAPKPEMTPDQKQFAEWMRTNVAPELSRFADVEKKLQQMEEMAQAQTKATIDRAVLAGRETIAKLSKDVAGISDPAQVKWIEQQVANSLFANQEDARSFQQGNVEVVKKHFDVFHKEFLDPLIKRNQATLTETKIKTAALPPRAPSAGVPAAITKQKKLTGKEHANAAFERLQELEKSGATAQ
jgi:hypothetical protein